jgi:hypothetical protein
LLYCKLWGNLCTEGAACCHAGCSRFSTGEPGSLDRLLPAYGALLFVTATLASWPASNNAAIFAEVAF